MTIDGVHTDHYAAGYMIKQVNPRIGMVTHTSFDSDLLGEALAGVQAHWDGLFAFGAPDGVVVNVTKDAIWNRRAPLPEAANPRPAPDRPPTPKPHLTVDKLVDKQTRNAEIDPATYTPGRTGGAPSEPRRRERCDQDGQARRQDGQRSTRGQPAARRATRARRPSPRRRRPNPPARRNRLCDAEGRGSAQTSNLIG